VNIQVYLSFAQAGLYEEACANTWKAIRSPRHTSLFFKDLSSTVITDDVIQRLVSSPNVILTGHQAFFTREALTTILDTTLASISDFAADHPLANEIQL
jgi:D-lactate dehydrogenase